MIMKDKGQNHENYQDAWDGFIPVNQKIETLYTDTNYPLFIPPPLALLPDKCSNHILFLTHNN